MSDSYDYDVVIIGSGPGGYVAAIRAGQLGLRTAIVEKDKLGGVCLNIGCIPSKALIHHANTFNSIPHLESLGVNIDTLGFDYRKVFAASRKAADTLSRGVAYLLKKNKVTVIEGTARVSSPHEITVDGKQTVSAGSIIAATGSRPREIPGFVFNEQTVLSSTGALMLEELPKKILILGGGAIGAEFAHIMNGFGVEVHMVEMMDHILPVEDQEISNVLHKSFTKRGITIYTSTKALSMRKEDGGLTVLLKTSNKKKTTKTADKILVVVGRVPNSEDIGLEELGVDTERGFISVGDYGETNVKGIYAIGDVVATPLLAHVASKEGEIAVEHIAGHTPRHKRIDLMAIPGAVYCEPQVASFGLTEEQAKKQNVTYKKATFPYRGAGKAVAVGMSEGLFKILYDPETKEILGAHGVGANATELIHEVLLAKTSELLPEDIATTIHAHPTMSETVMELARAAEGWAIHI